MTSDTTRTDELDHLLQDFDFAAPYWDEHFYDTQRVMRAECPHLRSERYGGFWALTRYADVVRVMTAPDEFSSDVPATFFAAERPALWPTETDDPLHRDIRRLLNPYFMAKQLDLLTPDLQSLANGIIDEFVANGRCDAATDFAGTFAKHSFFRYILNTPLSELDTVSGYVDMVMRGDDEATAAQGFGSLALWSAATLARRAEEPRRDDVIDALLHGTVLGRPLTMEEQIWTLLPVTLGGLDTSATVLGFGIHQLALQPALQERVRDDSSALTAAIDEFLRLGAPAPAVRKLTKDIELGGTQLRAGEKVLLAIWSANRDDDEFENADMVDLDREGRGNRHLAFGIGPHRCLGSSLARLLIRVGIQELLARVEDLRLTEGMTPQYRTSEMRICHSVPIDFTAR